MFFIFLIFFIPFVFYIAFPMGGAFIIRRNWYQFRKKLLGSLNDNKKSPLVRCFSRIQGYSRERTIWIQTENASLLADLRYCRFYQIATADKKDLNEVNDFENIDFRRYRRMHWNEFQRLPEGSKLYIIGQWDSDSSRKKIYGTKKNPVYAVLYEGEEDTVISRSLWGGRQFNEAWNGWTLWSLPLGFFFMITLFSFYIQIDSLRYLLPTTLIFTLMPLLFLLPPGLFLFLVYLKLWNIARLNRARRDLFTFYQYLGDLPECIKSPDYLFLSGLFQNTENLSLKQIKTRIRVMHLLSILCFICGLLLNFFLFYPFVKRIF